MRNNAIIVNRVYTTPNTVLKPQTEPFVLRLCLNNPNERGMFCGVDMAKPVDWLITRPYNHDGKGVCWEYDYSNALTKDAFEHLAWYASLYYTDNPYLIAVEGPGIGAWGEGGRWAYNKYRNINEPICSPADQLWYFNMLQEAFPGVPLMARTLTGAPDDISSTSVGLEVTNNTYDDVFGHPNSHIVQNQIIEYTCEDAFHGIEVYPELQEGFVKNPQSFITYWVKMNRKIAYMCKFCYQPKNKAEREGLGAIYDFVRGVGK